jgi:hypothetical protein
VRLFCGVTNLQSPEESVTRESSPRTLVGPRRTPRNILGDTVRLAAPTEEGAELPSQVPAIPLPRGAATLREIGGRRPRVARHPRRDRVATRPDRQPTSPVRTPISRGVPPDPPKGQALHLRMTLGSRQSSSRTFVGSRPTPRNILAIPTGVRSYPRRCPPSPCRGEPPPFVRSSADARGSRDILGEIVSPLVEFGSSPRG